MKFLIFFSISLFAFTTPVFGEVTSVNPDPSASTNACGRFTVTSRRGGNTRVGPSTRSRKCGGGAERRSSHNAFAISGNWIQMAACGGRAYIHKANISSSEWSRLKTQCQGSTTTTGPVATPREETSPSPSGSLSYASTFTSCAAEGRRSAASYARSRGKRSGCGYCANGTRHAIMCMFRKLGRPKYVHCGGAAYDYTDGCMSRHGFKRDMSSCNKAGVVRVYRGGRHRQRGASGGDRYGHIEFKGTDGRWHAGCSSSQAINERLGNSRRRLVGCYVLR